MKIFSYPPLCLLLLGCLGSSLLAPPPLRPRPAPNASAHTPVTHSPESSATKQTKTAPAKPLRQQTTLLTPSDHEHAAATRIQALFRGKAARMRVAKLKKQAQAVHAPLAHHDQEDHIGTPIKAVSKPHDPTDHESSQHEASDAHEELDQHSPAPQKKPMSTRKKVAIGSGVALGSLAALAGPAALIQDNTGIIPGLASSSDTQATANQAADAALAAQANVDDVKGNVSAINSTLGTYDPASKTFSAAPDASGLGEGTGIIGKQQALASTVYGPFQDGSNGQPRAGTPGTTNNGLLQQVNQLNMTVRAATTTTSSQ